MYYENQTYYDILGLPKNGKREDGTEVSFDSIERARNRLKFGGPDDAIPFSLWGKIDEAYDVLSNPERRKEYDRELYEKEHMSSSEVVNTEVNTVPEEIKEELAPEEIKEEPVSEEIKEEPVSEEIKEESVSEETKEEPISEETKEESVSEEIKEESVSEEIKENVNVEPFKPVRIKAATLKGAATSTFLSAPGNISAINSQDEEVISLYSQNIDYQVNKLLAEPHNNYKLEIIRVKLVNEVELYKKRLEIAKSFKKIEGYKIGYYFRVSSLTARLKTAQERLKSVEEKIKNYKWKSGLTKINEEIYKRTKEINDATDKDSVHVKNLEIRLNSLIKKRNKKGSKLKFGNYGEVLSGILSAKDFVVSVAKTPKYVTEGIQEAIEERKRTR